MTERVTITMLEDGVADVRFNRPEKMNALDPAQFADIVVQTGKDGQTTRVRDIGRVDLGAKNLDQAGTLDGKPSVGLVVYQLPGTGARKGGSGITD